MEDSIFDLAAARASAVTVPFTALSAARAKAAETANDSADEPNMRVQVVSDDKAVNIKLPDSTRETKWRVRALRLTVMSESMRLRMRTFAARVKAKESGLKTRYKA